MKKPVNFPRNGPPGLAKIRRRRIADDVYEQIRQAILERKLSPGERLDLAGLAERFDVSLMPVREAVTRLADAGLVEVKPRSGTFVATLDRRDIAETFDIRRALECLAAETAVLVATDAELASIEGLLRQMEASVENSGDSERHDELNTEFHRRIVALSRNPRLLEMYEQLNAHIKIARIHLRSGDWARRVAQEKREHRGIVKAIRERDAAALVEALQHHIERSKKVLTKDLADHGNGPSGSARGTA